AEQFIPGTELTVEGIKTNSRHHTLAVSTKSHFQHAPMVARTILYEQQPPGIDLCRLRAHHDALIHALDRPFVLTRAEYKVHQGSFYRLEGAARGGGANIASHIVPLISGYDTYRSLLQMALGERVDEMERRASQGAVLLEFFEFFAGKVSKIE